MKLHFIQNEATPHNNVLIQELVETEGLELELWYAREESDKYQWNSNPTHEIQHANIYGDQSINWAMIWKLLGHREEKVFQTGWGNPTTKMMVVLFWLTKRPYNMWFDYPQDAKKRNLIIGKLRGLFYWLLKHSRANVFCVGKMTVDYFAERGFSRDRLVNLPVLVDMSASKEDYIQHRDRIKRKYQVTDSELFLVAGSRLTPDKGYDLLIEALSMLPDENRARVKTLIIGRGAEKENILRQISEAGLAGTVFIEEWMDVEEYRACIATADAFVHPARWDAYGGSIYAMALGVPVIGSTGAGAVVDKVEHGQNGLIFPNGDASALSLIINELLDKPSSLGEMAKNMRQQMLQQNAKGNHPKTIKTELA